MYLDIDVLSESFHDYYFWHREHYEIIIWKKKGRKKIGHLYVKSDVYGFGVVLLEMLTGLRALDTKRPSGRQNLVDYAKPFLCQKRKLISIMDVRMEGKYSSKAALHAAQLTLRCLESEPKKRPSMKEVAETLEQIATIRKPKESKSKSVHSSSHHHHHGDRVGSGR
ncbi:probable serine/threonine-protein kinase PIX13 [Olea europaea var. sylvestris]|uniref:probable serine/threonine-protein kinase PIX13 n=1 Tax=Olea europaea var. sylvestris TaxID=158386 RepID=UPI000C1D1D70|nr:probable serine/threonine-protein kinase PIX13 [Olea europaea var. sylvestris]